LIQIMPAAPETDQHAASPLAGLPLTGQTAMQMSGQRVAGPQNGRSSGGPRGIGAGRVGAALRGAAAALQANAAMLAALDLAAGDGDLGATAVRIARALSACADDADETDIGRLLASAGVAVHRAVPSTMGALIGTALMRAGQQVQGKHIIGPHDLAAMLAAADAGLRARFHVHPGDKTLVDTIHPAAEAFGRAIEAGATLPAAGARMIAAARAGRDGVTHRRNRVGRASWLGARSAGLADPGATLALVVLEALATDPP
jgi:dihydroxyacetone kinase